MVGHKWNPSRLLLVSRGRRPHLSAPVNVIRAPIKRNRYGGVEEEEMGTVDILDLSQRLNPRKHGPTQRGNQSGIEEMNAQS